MVMLKSDGNGGRIPSEWTKMIVYILTIILSVFAFYNMTIGDLKGAVLSNTITLKKLGIIVDRNEINIRSLELDFNRHKAAQEEKDKHEK